MTTTTEKPKYLHKRTLSRLHAPGHEPNRREVLQSIKELNANAASIRTVYGHHGHLFLSTLPERFTALNNNVTFTIPDMPPVNPVLPNNPTGPVIIEANRVHAAAVVAYDLMRSVEMDLHNQLLKSADDTYFEELEDLEYGYTQLSVHALVTHHLDNYGGYTESDGKELRCLMEVPWEGGPFQVVVQQLLHGAKAARSSATNSMILSPTATCSPVPARNGASCCPPTKLGHANASTSKNTRRIETRPPLSEMQATPLHRTPTTLYRISRSRSPIWPRRRSATRKFDEMMTKLAIAEATLQV